MKQMLNKLVVLMAFLIGITATKCSTKGGGPPVKDPSLARTAVVEAWITKGDQSELLKKQTLPIRFMDTTNSYGIIEVDSNRWFQEIDGFGFTLTGGSATLINSMGSSKAALLQELFGQGGKAIGINYLRISIGASDLSDKVFSYNDLPAGQADPGLERFSLSRDTIDLVPVLKEILAINPAIKIMGSPWSPPVWMKDNANSIGGELLPKYYSVYANYFVKYIRAMAANGISIDAITIQNEPQHGGNNPSLVMSADQQADFIRNHLGPAFQAAGIKTRIIVWDHNCDNPEFPITILNDPAAKKYVYGSAFHLYNGDISALSTVHAAHPDRALYFTEQWTAATGDFGGDLTWHMKHVIIGSMRNWSRTALEWNLANNPAFGPHTPGGCTACKGALTISGSSVSRNVSYYTIGHASKFIPAGSVRIASTELPGISNVVFKTPTGRIVMLVVNDSNAAVGFNIKFNGKQAFATLPSGAAATYTW